MTLKTKLNSGQVSLNNSLATEDILAIIEAAGKHGVLRLKFGRLELEFCSKTPEPLVDAKVISPAPFPVDPPTIERSDDPPNEEEIKAVKEVERILKETQLQNLQLENPLLYEELVAQGEIDNEPSFEDGPE